MTTSEQAAVIMEAIRNDFLQGEDVTRWADRVIVTTEKPPDWLIEVSTLNAPYTVDYVARLREHADCSLPIRRRVELIVVAHDRGLLTFRETLPLLFRVMMIERGGQKLDSMGERLAEALIDWDFQEDLDSIDAQLRATFEALFHGYLATGRELADLLPSARPPKVEPIARPNDEERA